MTLPLWILALLSVAIGVMFAFHHPEPEFERIAKEWLRRAWVRTVALENLICAEQLVGCEHLKWVTALDLDGWWRR